MARSFGSLAAMVSIVALAACAAEPADDSRLAGGMAGASGGHAASEQVIRACDLLDLTAATRVIGSGTEHPGGDTEELTCVYSNAGVATLSLQLSGAEYYDQITIMPPHTSVQIGDKGRHNVQENGAVAVQFVKGAYSVTMAAQPIGTNQTNYLEALITAAQEVASRLP